MTQESSRIVTTNQEGIHEDLIVTLVKHLATVYNKPIATHSQKAFDDCCLKVESIDRAIILDSGCGIGQSTKLLADAHPEAWVIGVDQSEHRLGKQPHDIPENCLFVRADLIDFWRLAIAKRWQLMKHFILYPNPWPKAKHFKRRWHAHPVFPTILNLGGELTLRSNWDIYVLEFATILDYLGYATRDIQSIMPNEYMTPFEKKYFESGQELYELRAEIA